ncbi:MAG: MBL fold metallo-hydrolase [Bacillota bacterium]|nr:MBL fold metallo-hydrolase [Bacillota bacterium]
MQLTVLGCYGPYPAAGKACSGYLLQEDSCSLLLDCGNGVFSRLQEHFPFYELAAVFLSHLHADHISDVFIMRYGLEMAFKNSLRSEPLRLYAPVEPVAEFSRLSYKNAYRVEPLGEGGELTVGPFTIYTASGIHAVPSLAMRVECSNKKLAYSADTEYCQDLVDLAEGVDFFLCEANYREEDIRAGLPNHLSAAQAAGIARKAGVGRLVLTHHHPERDPEDAIREAAKIFPVVEAAREGKTYIIQEETNR